MTEEQLKTLLQQRANPQAPDGYYEDLLRNLHQRQRSELLHKSLWRIAYDRISTFWGEHSFSSPAYTLALASITAVGIISILSFKPATSADSAPTASRSIPTSKLDVLPAAAVQEGDPILDQKKRQQNPEANPYKNR